MGTIPLTPPSNSMGPIQVQEATIKVLIAHYKHGPDAIEAVKDIRDYVEASLASSAFVENTNITLKEDPVQVSPDRRSPCDNFTQGHKTLLLPPPQTRIGRILHRPPQYQYGPLPSRLPRDLSPPDTLPPQGQAQHHTCPALQLADTGRPHGSTPSFSSIPTACLTGHRPCNQP